MKRIFSLALAFLLAFSAPGFSAWDASEILGTRNASDIDTYSSANFEALEDTLQNMRGWVNLKVVRTNVTTVTVTADSLWLQRQGISQESSLPFRKRLRLRQAGQVVLIPGPKETSGITSGS